VNRSKSHCCIKNKLVIANILKHLVTGIILAGGKSSRFGSDKALYEYRGMKLIEYAIDVLKPLTHEILISTNKPADYEFTGLKTFQDAFPGQGPLSGIHSGLLHSAYDKTLVVGCDMPYLELALFEYLLNHSNRYQVIYPTHNGFTESMVGYYHKSCLDIIEAALKQGNNKILNAVEPLKVLFLNVDDQDFYDSKLFRNINSQKDLDF
jgi:molybdenum cofactor guanylyltransferase